MSKLLGEEKAYTETIFYPIAHSVLRSLPLFEGVIDSGFYRLRIGVYEDSDKKMKVAVGVAFLQDYMKVVNDLERIVLDGLHERFQELNLDLIVNDFTINDLQVRDYQVNSLL